MPTTIALLALRSLREYWLMPLVTTRPGSDVAATTVPPGHMQQLDTERPVLQAGSSAQLAHPRAAPFSRGIVGHIGHRGGHGGRGEDAVQCPGEKENPQVVCQ